MTTQRGTGILYTSFASLVFMSALISRAINSLPMFIQLDIITIGCVAIFLISVFLESVVMKTLQILMITLVCVGILLQGNYYLGLALFTNAFFIMFAYGVYNKYIKAKIILSILIIYGMYLIAAIHDGTSFVYSFNWIIFVVVHIVSIWIVFRATVDKARKFDASKEMQLDHKINEMTEELYKTQVKLNDAVSSGLELISIVKELKNGRR